MHESEPFISAIVLAYGPDPWLRDCLDGLLHSTGVVLEIIVVDNGCTDPQFLALALRPGIRLIRPPRNLGFSGGCNLAATTARTGGILVFVNADCVVAPTTLLSLARALDDDSVGLATARIRLGSAPELLNSAGNPVHFTGLSWAGHHGDAVATAQDSRDVASASGACFAVRKPVWEELDGFAPEYFAYHEDVDLSLRCWLSGRRVTFVPDADALHHYEFSRNSQKMYLVERNRLLSVLTVYETSTLIRIVPSLLLTELAITLMALAHGWLPAKIRGWAWLAVHMGWIRRRRRCVQGGRRTSDEILSGLLASDLPGALVGDSRAAGLANWFLRLNWQMASRRFA